MTDKCPTCGANLRMNPQPGLSPTQFRVLALVSFYIEEHGYSPSYRELATLHKTTVSAVYKIVKRLVARGYISHLPSHHRTLTVIADQNTLAHLAGDSVDVDNPNE